jgi:hypothetical protein
MSDAVTMAHLLRVVVLCQTPRETWTPEDTKAFREAREFVQKYREETGEGKREEAGSGAFGNTTEGTNFESTQGRVCSEGIPVEERAERAPSNQA